MKGVSDRSTSIIKSRKPGTGGLWKDFGKAKGSHQFYAIGRVTVSIYAANVNASLCQVEYNTFFTPWAVGKNAVSMRGAQVTLRGILCPL